MILKGGVSNSLYPALDSKGNVYYIDDYGNISTNSSFINKLASFGKNIKASVSNINDWLNNSNPYSEDYKNKANAILGITTAPFGMGNTATKMLSSKLAPFLGSKIAQLTAEGMGGGLTGGSIEGFGRGFIEDDNPIKTMLIDGTVGAVSGALGGLGFGKTEKYLTAGEIKKLKGQKKLNTEERKLINNYYSNYERGLNTINKNAFIGKIELPSQGMKETIRQKPQKAAEVLNLNKSLINADYISPETPKHNHKFKIKQFHRLRKDKNDYLIAENINGNKYFHKITDSHLTEPKSEGMSPTAIISDYTQNINPAENNNINNYTPLIAGLGLFPLIKNKLSKFQEELLNNQ